MPKKTSTKKATFGADLIEGMKLVLAHQRHKVELEQVSPKRIDIKAIRKRVNVPGQILANVMGSASALFRSGSRAVVSLIRPRGPILTIIAKEPALVRRALASE